MRVIVKFSKLLSNYTDIETIEIDVASYRDVISACLNLLPKFRQIFVSKKLYNQIVLIDQDRYIRSFELDFSPRSSSIFLVPTISGGIASSFDSLGNLNIFYGTSTTFSNQEMTLKGVDRRVRDSALFGQSQTAFDIAQRRTNRENGTLDNSEDPTRGFGSLATMNAIGSNIPLHFGMVRTSGSVINQYIKHLQRGGIDNIRVADYI
jgi:predicted phage tail protein